MNKHIFRSVLTVVALILTVTCVLSFTSCDFEFKVFKDPSSTNHQTDKPSPSENAESDNLTQEPTDTDPTPDTDAPTVTEPAPDTDAPTVTDPTPETDAPTVTEPAPDTDAPTVTDPAPDTDAPTVTDPAPDTDAPTITEPAPDTDAPTVTEPAPDTDAPTEPDDPGTEHKHSYTAKTTAPTCTEQGYTTYTCTCGDNYKADYKNKLGHDLKKYSRAPTCTESGYEKSECSRCDYTETKTTAATGHSFTKNITAPTCTKQGFTTYTCSCGYSETGDYIKATGHSFGVWKTVTDATTSSDGLERRDCLNCDEFEERAIPRIEEIPTDFIPYEGNSLWGYTYLNKQSNAENLKAFYRDLDHTCRAFYTNFTNVTDEKFAIGSVNYADRSLTSDEAILVYRVFTLDTPRYYWLAKQYYHNSTTVTLCVDEAYATGLVRKEIAADVSAFIAELKALANNYSTTSEKALAIHDYIINRIDYKYEADGVTPLNTVWAHNILGVVQGLGGVCETYAETFQMVLSSIGIDCITVHGDAPTAHAWNTVKFEDGKWYNIDVTWDDLSNGNMTYLYFGQSHSTFAQTHKAYPSSSGATEYMFDYPTPQNDVDLSPVTLYKNGSLVGRFVSFQTSFLAMTDKTADYTVEMDDYYGTYKLYDDIPSVKSVRFKGAVATSGQSYYITTLQIQKTVTASTNVILENVALEGKTNADCVFNILGNTLTLTGIRVNLNNGFTLQGDSVGKMVISTSDQTQLASDVLIGSVTVTPNAACIVINGVYNVETLTIENSALVIIYDLKPVTFNVGKLVCESGNGQIQLKGRADTTFTVGSIKGTAQYALMILMVDSVADIPRITFKENAEIPLYFAFWPQSSSLDIKSYDGTIFTAPSLSSSKVAFFLYENGSLVNKIDLFELKNGECKVIKS